MERNLLNSMQKRSVINSPGVTELRRKKYKAFKTKAIVFAVLFVVIVIGLCWLSRIKEMKIQQINISGNVIVDTKSIEDVVEADIAGHYWGIFPKSNFLIFPKNKILADLSGKYKRLNNISLKVINFNTLDISVNEYNGKYLWCGLVTPMLNNNSNQKCYFIDSNGYIFDEAPFFSGSVYFKFYGQTSDLIDPTGTYFYPDTFSKLIQLKNSLDNLNLKPTYIYINNQNEVNVGLSTQGIAPINPAIIFRLDSDFEKIIENLNAAINTEPLQTDLQKNYAKLLYIDLRYGNKVYYKFSTSGGQ